MGDSARTRRAWPGRVVGQLRSSTLGMAADAAAPVIRPAMSISGGRAGIAPTTG